MVEAMVPANIKTSYWFACECGSAASNPQQLP